VKYDLNIDLLFTIYIMYFIAALTLENLLNVLKGKIYTNVNFAVGQHGCATDSGDSDSSGYNNKPVVSNSTDR